jgi:YD repeat-containing protein
VELNYVRNGNGDAERIERYTGGSYDGKSEYSYDKAGRVLWIQHFDQKGSRESLNYTYDAVGRVKSESGLGSVTNYTYDDAGRLLSAGAETFSYDATGNATGKGLPGNRVTGEGSWIAAGRMPVSRHAARFPVEE